MLIYRGYDISQTESGMWEWTDEQGRVHNGKVDTKGGYKTAEAAESAIDQYRREKLAGERK